MNHNTERIIQYSIAYAIVPIEARQHRRQRDPKLLQELAKNETDLLFNKGDLFLN